MVGEDEVASVIDAAKGVEDCASDLLGLALSNGGRDNISIVVARILSAYDPSQLYATAPSSLTGYEFEWRCTPLPNEAK